jgi:DNA invertase Pin-like site-specific DNA recombinase
MLQPRRLHAFSGVRMSANVFGYVRLPAAGLEDGGDAAGQLALIKGYSTHHGLDLVGVFTDTADAASVPWLDRPAGQQLAARLGPGCHVVIAGGVWIWTSPGDLLAVLRDWRERDITLHVAVARAFPAGPDFSLRLAGAQGEAMLAALAAAQSLNRAGHGEAVREGMRRRKAEGRKYCRHAGYGFVWRGPKGKQRRVPHAGEQEVMAHIVAWRHAGLSWYEIAAHLLQLGVQTADGRIWSPSRVRRACFAALRQRAAHPAGAKVV